MVKTEHLDGYCVVTTPMSWAGGLHENRIFLVQQQFIGHIWQEVSQVQLFKSHFYLNQSVDPVWQIRLYTQNSR